LKPCFDVLMESGRVPKGFHGSKEVEGTRKGRQGRRAGQGKGGTGAGGGGRKCKVQCSAVRA
jgi:hypothetical protein